jgi:hypothetical protein
MKLPHSTYTSACYINSFLYNPRHRLLTAKLRIWLPLSPHKCRPLRYSIECIYPHLTYVMHALSACSMLVLIHQCNRMFIMLKWNYPTLPHTHHHVILIHSHIISVIVCQRPNHESDCRSNVGLSGTLLNVSTTSNTCYAYHIIMFYISSYSSMSQYVYDAHIKLPHHPLTSPVILIHFYTIPV